MTAAALGLWSLVTLWPAGIRTSPFAEGATFSYEIAPNTIAVNGLPIEAIVPRRAMARALPIDEGIPAAIPSMLGDVELEDAAIPGVRGVYPPNASDVPDWRTIYRITIGVQLEGLEDYHWTQPGNTLRPFEALLHLKATFAQLRAMYLRDVGVDLQIVHVHLREAQSIWPDTDSGNSHEAQLAIDNFKDGGGLVMNTHPVVVLRLGDRIGGGKAHLSGPCYDGERGVVVSRSWYDLSIGPVQTADNWRNVVVGIVAQELSHHILGLGHAQCYHDDAGEPIERCFEIGCYEGVSVCPAFTVQSFMGYCYPCGGPVGGLADPPMRLGPWHGALARVARLHVLQYAADCGLEAVGQLPDDTTMQIDADHDAQPDAIDNHVKFINNEQGDWFGCAVTPPARGAWLLFLPLAVLWRIRPMKTLVLLALLVLAPAVDAQTCTFLPGHTRCLGDRNCDAHVTVADIQNCVNLSLALPSSGQEFCRPANPACQSDAGIALCDLNCDFRISIDELQVITNNALGTGPCAAPPFNGYDYPVGTQGNFCTHQIFVNNHCGPVACTHANCPTCPAL